MRPSTLTAAYLVVAEALLHCDDRDDVLVGGLQARLADDAPEIAACMRAFLESPASRSADEYVQTLELSPPCPLYLGAYLFEEPTSCRGVGISGRNEFMIELRGIYGHFGLGLGARELPDFVPLVADFLAISLERQELDRIGLRRMVIEQYVRPALGPMLERLIKHESIYARVLEAFRLALDADVAGLVATSAWSPPGGGATRRRSLPVARDGARSIRGKGVSR